MAQIGITIESSNFNGESVDISFAPFSGGTINLGTQTIPYDYLSTNYEGVYTIDIPSVPKTCFLTVGTAPSPTPSPTSSVTPTVTPTMTPTPTPSAAAGDPDATAYLAAVVSAGGTTDATIDAAVDTLFVDLKAAGVYSKLFAFYPVVGGVAGSHAINANLATSYDLTFAGGWTHDVSGMTTNNTNSLGNTNATPQDLGSAGTGLDNHHMLSSQNQIAFPGYEGAGPSPYLAHRLSGIQALDAQSNISPGTQFDQVGIQVVNRVANADMNFQVSASGGTISKNSNTNTATSINSNDIYIGSISNTSFYTAARYNFWSIGDGLTDSQVSDYFDAINTFNNSLSRRGY